MKNMDEVASPRQFPGRLLKMSRLRSRAWMIAAAYAFFAMLWIYFSDRALQFLIPDPDLFLRWSVYKGIAFVALTSIILFLLMLRAFGTIESSYIKLKAHKAEIERINQLHAALSQINQAIVSSKTRDELFQKVCRMLVEEGGFCMAWLGWHSDESKELLPIAAWGDGSEKVKHIIVDGDKHIQAQQPLSRVLNEGRPYICNDMQHDPATRLWWREARLHNFQASAIFPIRDSKSNGGVLNVYANETYYFQEKEIDLLTEVVSDLSFALDNFARDEDHRNAEILAGKERYFSQAMIESMPGILYFYDNQGKFLRWNKNFEQVSGYSGAEIGRMHPLQFFHTEEQKPLAERIVEVFEFGQSSVEANFLSKDGTQTPYFFTGRRILFDGVPCLVGVGIDITERVAAEAALRELNETLEHKVVERTAELESAVVRAEAADRIKSAFLATMSHELRTPLNSIIGFTGIVLQGLAGPLTEEQTKQLGMVRESARHLLDLINDVLDLSKIEAGQLEVRAEPFDLNTSIERVVGLVKPLAEKQGLKLNLDTLTNPTTIVGDRRRVEQVLINLLSNGIKFTAAGTITLTVSLLDAEGNNDSIGQPAVRFSVMDTGMGIQPEDLAILFQPFQQLDNGLNRQHEGTGLGLVICRRLAELMGGTIYAKSELSKGSEFIFVLPITPTSSL